MINSEKIKNAPKRSRRIITIKIKKKKQLNPLHRVNKEKFPHFRQYKKSNHPALIEGEQVDKKQREEWIFKKVTHSAKEGKKNNLKIEPNPNPKDKKPMYIVKRKRHDLKTHFSSWKYDWKIK